MQFDANHHRCTIVIDNQLPAGLAMNAASVIGISFGKLIENLVGPDRQSEDGLNYPGVIYAPLPVLLAEGNTLRELQKISSADTEIFAMPFSALAQSCKTYDEYGERIASAISDNIELVAIGLIGPKKKITRLTGNLKLYR
ncbi:DUF2000 domain-containing protein [Pantoea rwandensis]|uniref:DUF2000 domain-containing protein n=1 Tax=Pantoea rwandensis TaxID=1076550 RepID=A0A1X1D4T5_9GAMM|nr:DUF2000 domain-containing protein [Pantoea rwandensis]ORM71637.1 hypothetical protein HA51_00725 [Pantoea rwandensis]